MNSSSRIALVLSTSALAFGLANASVAHTSSPSHAQTQKASQAKTHAGENHHANKADHKAMKKARVMHS
ncbi:hypothetical protein [Allopusillimonas ginsengisoli]|uniref:hypothetical protein n=1 Tax=Allopusillimonas ginsengisoli TaxID=453575 RepID=UPI00101F4429|nr:hypothetical protein [Allopusillimonas ginsengisoli]TEA79860.1 hypothetical protein ERE07_02675 [Allopusillimonas ginsengisoli]